MTNVSPNADNNPPLDQLVETLPPEELAQHPRLGIVYAAARTIVLASYGGRITTSRIEGFADEDEPLVRQLLNRYEDERGFVSFPVLRGTAIDELIVSGSGVARYRLVREGEPANGQEGEGAYFTSFPAS